MAKTIHTSIDIHAPVDIIWEILMDFDVYSAWNPFIVQLKGAPIVGEKLFVQIAPPMKKTMQFNPTVQVCISQQEFEWLGTLGMKGLFDGRHQFRLTVIDKQTVRFEHSEHFSGWLVPFINLKSTEQGFQLMNEALKTRAEQRFQLAKAS